MKTNSVKNIIVRKKPGADKTSGLLQIGAHTIPCKLGKNGIKTLKKEGDGATPIGHFRILYGYFRSDRLIRPATSLDLKETATDDGWCDDITSPNYNHPVKLPFVGSHEIMTRKDRLYDICLVLDYNIYPVTRGAGSAIFFHLTSEERKPTLGCIAIDPSDMKRLLPLISSRTVVTVLP